MKKITLTYQLWVRCDQQIEVPDDYIVPTDKIGYAQFQDLREKYSDHEIWDTIPDSDGDDTNIHDHLDYVSSCGLDIQEEGKVYTPDFSIEIN
jgi:hypothetical protein